MKLSKLGMVLNLVGLCLALYGLFGGVTTGSNVEYILMVLLLVINVVGILIHKHTRS